MQSDGVMAERKQSVGVLSDKVQANALRYLVMRPN